MSAFGKLLILIFVISIFTEWIDEPKNNTIKSKEKISMTKHETIDKSRNRNNFNNGRYEDIFSGSTRTQIRTRTCPICNGRGYTEQHISVPNFTGNPDAFGRISRDDWIKKSCDNCNGTGIIEVYY